MADDTAIDAPDEIEEPGLDDGSPPVDDAPVDDAPPQDLDDGAEPGDAGDDAGDQTDDDADGSDDASGDEAMEWLRGLAQETGIDISQFATPVEAIKAGFHAKKLVGARDDDAARYQELRKRLGDDGLRALEQTAQQQRQQQGSDNNPIPSVDEIRRLKARADKGDQRAQHQFDEINEAATERFYQLVGMLPHLQQVVEMAEKGAFVTQATYSQQREAEKAHLWIQAHARDLYQNGEYNPNDAQSGLSVIGSEFAELVNGGMSDWNAALAKAKRLAAPSRPPGMQQPSKRAKRTGSARTDKKKPQDVGKLYDHLQKIQGDDAGLFASLAGVIE